MKTWWKIFVVLVALLAFMVGTLFGTILVVAERPAGAVSPDGGQAEMPAAVRGALHSSCDPIQVAAAIRVADVYRRSAMTEGLSVTMRTQWGVLALAEEAYVERCR